MAKKKPTKQTEETLPFKIAMISVENNDGVKFFEVKAIVPENLSEEANKEVELLLTKSREDYMTIFNKYFFKGDKDGKK